MKKGIYLTGLILTCYLGVRAQKLVTTSGGSIRSTTTQVNWTIGESITETFSSNKTSISSGFNQPTLIISTAIKEIGRSVVVRIYPNPTSQYVNIKIDGSESVVVKVLSLNGVVVSEAQTTGQ